MRSLIIAFLIGSGFAVASPLPDFPFVYAYGSATREVVPDNASINFWVKSYDAEAEAAFRRQSEIANALLSFAEKSGVRVDDIVAQPIGKTAKRREDERGNEFEIVGYETSRSVSIALNDLALFPLMIEYLYGQSYIENISVVFGSKDKERVLQDLTDDACKVATENAQRLSRGFRRQLGSVRAISEHGFAGLGRAFGLAGDADFRAGAVSAPQRDFRSIPATITFQKSVYAIFALE